MQKTHLSLIISIIFLLSLQLWAQDMTADCDAPLEIWQVQGNGEIGNCVGERVEVGPGIVTVIGLDGFFFQPPLQQFGGDLWTSNGLYVLTNRNPGLMGIAVGDEVRVDGKIEEAFGMTQVVARTPSRITVLSSGNLLPDPIGLDRVVLEGAPEGVHPLERWEGVFVHVDNAVANGPTNRFDEYGITLNGERQFREPGIEGDRTPELLGIGLPEWDLNPQVVEVDAGETAVPVPEIWTGMRTSVEGALAYSFRDYQIWPSSIEVEPLDMVELQFAREREEGEFTIATQNVLNLFDTVDDPNRDDGRFENWTPVNEEEYAQKLRKTALQILIQLDAPDIVSLQEVENSRVLTDLIFAIYQEAETLRQSEPPPQYSSCLLEGNEGRGIDVAFLVRTERVNILDCYRMPGSLDAMYDDGMGRDFLYTRPPLVLEVELLGEDNVLPLTIVGVHLRSLNDVETDRVQRKRMLQAIQLALFIQNQQIRYPHKPMVVLGDFNAFQFSDGLVDIMGIITGSHDPTGARMSPQFDIVEPNLVNHIFSLETDEQYTYVFNSNAQVLDHILTTENMRSFVTDIQVTRGNADAPIQFESEPSGVIRSSDHDGLVLFVNP